MHNKGTRRGDASDDHRAAAGPNPAGVLSSCRRNEGCVARSFRTASSPDSTDYHDHKTPAPVGSMHPHPQRNRSQCTPAPFGWAIVTREASPGPFRIPPSVRLTCARRMLRPYGCDLWNPPSSYRRNMPRRYTADTPPKTTNQKPKTKNQKPKTNRSEEHTSELQSRGHLVCRLLLE